MTQDESTERLVKLFNSMEEKRDEFDKSENMFYHAFRYALSAFLVKNEGLLIRPLDVKTAIVGSHIIDFSIVNGAVVRRARLCESVELMDEEGNTMLNVPLDEFMSGDSYSEYAESQRRMARDFWRGRAS